MLSPEKATFNLGEKFSFEAEIDLPKISSNDPKPIRVEFFSFDSSDTTNLANVFHICNPNIKSFGDNLVFSNSSVNILGKPQLEYSTTYASKYIVEKAIFDLGNVHTNDLEDVEQKNKATFTFEAIAPNLPTLVNEQVYSLVAGVSYNEGNIIWVSQSDFTANISTTSFSAQGSVDSSAIVIDQGDSAIIKATLIITNPSPKLVIKVKSLEGYDDKFHIGEINLFLGESFQCLAKEFWEFEYKKSYSRENIAKAKLTVPMLLNTDITRDIALDGNKIEISIPITALEGVDVPGSYKISIGAMLDVTEVWSGSVDITINSQLVSQSAAQPSSVSGELISDTVFPGSSAVFKLTVEVEAGAIADLTVVASCSDEDVSAVSAFIVQTGMCGGVLLDGVPSVSGDDLTVGFGNCKNLASSTTQVVIYVAYETKSTIAQSSAKTVSVSVGGFAFNGLQFTTATVSSDYVRGEMTAIGTSLGFDNEGLYPDTEIGLNVLVNMPADMTPTSLFLETTSSIKSSTLDIRLCKIEVTSVGKGLPCLKQLTTSPHINKSEEVNQFNDLAYWDLGNTCPASISGLPEENTFEVNLIYSLPSQPDLVSGIEISPALGIWTPKNTPSTLFAAISAKNTTASALTAFEYSTKEYSVGSDVDPTMQFESSPIKQGGIGHSRFIIKLQQRTRFPFIFYEEATLKTRICRIKVKRIGDNMPCVQKPEGYLGKFNPARIDYGGDVLGNKVTLNLGVVTNWGKNEMEYDLYGDDDAFEIHTFFHADESANDYQLKTHVGKLLGPKPITKKGASETELSSDADQFLNLSPVFENVLSDELNTALKGVPKVVSLKLTIPSGFKGTVEIEFKNPEFASLKYDFCDIKITNVGLNCPCIDRMSSFNRSSIEDSGFVESLQISLQLQHYQYSMNPTESEVHVEVTLRIPTDYTGDAKLLATIDKTSESATLDFTVLDVGTSYGDSPDSDFTVSTESNTVTMQAYTGDKIWVPFNISIPRNSVIPLKLAIVTPAENGRAIMTVEMVRFKDTGSSICCINSNLNVEHMFGATRSQTPNVTTFMQKDIMEIDMGYVVNGHFAERREYEIPTDSHFVVDVLVQMSDHPATIPNSKHSVSLAAKSNDTIVVGSYPITVLRAANQLNRKTTERALISMTMEVEEPSREYVSGDQITVSAIIAHSHFSKAEGHDAVNVRLITPMWLGFDSVVNTCQTNYTENAECTVEHPHGDKNSSVTFVFNNGIYYSDIISINFTLTVDPLGKLPFGKGLLDSAIVSQVQCKQSVFHSYPATNETLNVCGAYVHTSVKVLSPPCDAHITIEDSCAVSSSTAFDDQHLPSNVLTNDASVWSPAIRSGSKWNNNIVFDFQEIVAPNSVTILAPASGYNIPSKVSIYSSFSVSDSSYTKIENSVAVPADGKIQLSIRTHARFMKIMIEESSGGYEKIGISYVEWRGCPKSSTSPLSCGPDTTRLSTDPTKYRHFAVDPAKQILYFCDVNPYRVGIFCYSVKKETLTFVELPHYIRYIQGYSTVKGRMYFKEIQIIKLSIIT